MAGVRRGRHPRREVRRRKSFLVLDWSCCAASERNWQGRRTDKANVLYIAGEGGVAQAKRFKAWKQEHGEIEDDTVSSCAVRST